LAAASPVLVVVDHGQWIDEASAEPLLFVFRRLEGTRIAAVVGGVGATRSGPPPHPAATVAPEPALDSPQQLLAQADQARAAGKPDRALQLLESALGSTTDPLVRADAQGILRLERLPVGNHLVGVAGQVDQPRRPAAVR
jgi:hypothetical protein